MIKDVADLFAAEGEGARKVIEELKLEAKDALDEAISEAPEGSARERYRYVRESIFPLLLRLEDAGERGAALNDVAEALGLGKKDLKKAFSELEEVAREEPEKEPVSPEEYCEVSEEDIDELVGKPGVLQRFVEAVTTYSRVVGERPALKVVALCAASAQLELLPNGKPIAANIIVSAGASRGKNYLCDAVARPLPPEFYLAFESSSAKAFYYMAKDDPEFLKHRFVYPNEAEGVDLVVEMLRPLLSGGKTRHNTVNKDARGRNVHQQFTIEGPVAIAVPTVRNKLDTQLQTRMLILGLEDYEGRVAAHSRAVSGLLSPNYAGTDYTREIQIWQAALRCLTHVRRVVIPIDRDEFRFSSDAVSHGARLWANLLGMMCGHAWLEQRNREIETLPNGEKAIVAAPEDYEAAYTIFEATCERSVQNLSDTHRKILDALYKLHEEDRSLNWAERSQSFSQRRIAREASIPQSTITDNKTFLVKSAKLLREPEGGGLALVEGADPSWWEKDDVLVGFPRPEQVWRWWNGENDPPPDPETPGQGGQAHRAAAKHDSNGAKGDRPPAGHHLHASGHSVHNEADHHADRLEDPGDRRGPGQEKGVDKGKNASESELTGVTGGFEDNHEEVGKKSEGHLHPDGGSDERYEHYPKDIEKCLGPGWESQAPGVLLGKLGWARKESLAESLAKKASLGDPSGVNKWTLKRDPVARMILDTVSIYDVHYKLSNLAVTDTDLAALVWKHRDKKGRRLASHPINPIETRERLAKMLPAMMTKRRYWDPDATYHTGLLDYDIFSEASLYVERWEKQGQEEGIWYFVALKPDQCLPKEEIEKRVWEVVREVEGLTEDDSNPEPGLSRCNFDEEEDQVLSYLEAYEVLLSRPGCLIMGTQPG